MTNRSILIEADKLLLDSGICELPLRFDDLRRIAKNFGWLLATYQDSQSIIESLGAEDLIKERPAFTVKHGGKNIILYNSYLTYETKINVICHEFGHIVLEHTSENDIVGFSYNLVTSYKQENEANVFAAELMAPACILSKIGIKNVYELCQLGLLNHKAAVKHFPNIKNILPLSSTEVLICEKITIRYYKKRNFYIKLSLIIVSIIVVIGLLAVIFRTFPDKQTALPENTQVYSSIELVYITQSGEKYHKSHCWHITDCENTIEITLEEAQNGGFEPCKDCFGNLD